jgi:hypothetical protein
MAGTNLKPTPSPRAVSRFIWLWLGLTLTGYIAWFVIGFLGSASLIDCPECTAPQAELYNAVAWGVLLLFLTAAVLPFFWRLKQPKLGLGLLVLELILPVWLLTVALGG